MICCKIITNFSAKEGSFDQLCTLLGKKGSWMWDSGNLYFADTEGDTDKKTIMRIVKKAGYEDAYIYIYDKDNEPRENEEHKAWIADKLVKIYYLQFERENQKVLQETSQGLDQLNEELNHMIKEIYTEQAEDKKTEDSSNGG